MVHSDSTIMSQVASGDLIIEPFFQRHLNPASYDLTMSNDIRVGEPTSEPLDLRRIEPDYLRYKGLGNEPYTMQPGEFLLASTAEEVGIPTHLAAAVEGKSSLARVGLIVHVTAGWIDPGFMGNVTLELLNVARRPLVIYPGMRIAQLTLVTVEGRVNTPYHNQGRYMYQYGPTLSAYNLCQCVTEGSGSCK